LSRRPHVPIHPLGPPLPNRWKIVTASAPSSISRALASDVFCRGRRPSQSPKAGRQPLLRRSSAAPVRPSLSGTGPINTRYGFLSRLICFAPLVQRDRTAASEVFLMENVSRIHVTDKMLDLAAHSVTFVSTSTRSSSRSPSEHGLPSESHAGTSSTVQAQRPKI
jgi:hypothetical protein